jgi:Fringe-like
MTTMLSRRPLVLVLAGCLTIFIVIFVCGAPLDSIYYVPSSFQGNFRRPGNHRITKQSAISFAKNGRYESAEVWRNADWFADTSLSSIEANNRPHLHGQSLQNPLIADYAPGSDKLFLMIKTGATVLWQRLPIHLSTTLTRVPKFALYSDAPGSIAGYEVIDILANVTEESKGKQEFTQYRRQKWLHDKARVIDYTSLKTNDGWQLDKFKNVPMLDHAYRTSPDSDWFFFMDADTHVVIDNLMDLVKDLDPNQPHYIGSVAGSGHYAFCHGGSGVLLSRAALEKSVGMNDWAHIMEQRTFDECCGDLMVGYLMIDAVDTPANDTKGFNGSPYWDLKLNADNWCDPIITFHHVIPREVEIIWEYEKSKRGTADRNGHQQKITNSLLYHDFFLPFMADKKENWDNRAISEHFSTYDQDKDKGIIPKSQGGHEERPYESFEACKEFCEKQENCLSFRISNADKRCDISESFRYGRPVENWLRTSSDYPIVEVTSGWMLDRIQSLRKASSCDSSTHSGDDAGDRLIEGWFNKLEGQDRV